MQIAGYCVNQLE